MLIVRSELAIVLLHGQRKYSFPGFKAFYRNPAYHLPKVVDFLEQADKVLRT
jgi:hypothetical protein